MKRKLIFLLLALPLLAHADEKLTGKVIGTQYSVDYSNNQRTTTVNTKDMAFDGNMDTYFASYDRSNTWVGLDLGKPYVITSVAWSPRKDSNGPGRVNLGLFEGSNREDFLDAVPLYMIKENGTQGVLSEADVIVTKGFRYVRYMGPNDARCNIAEVEFRGHEGEGTDDRYYQVTNLPTVVFHTENAVNPYDKEHDLVSVISIISKDGKDLLQKDGTTRLRGNASMNFPKKPYRIKFEKKQKVLDAPAKAKKWTLINNYGDKTLMRNLIAFEVSKRLGMRYTPYGTPVDVIVNGEYKGCYQLCDQVEVGTGRVDITEMEPTDIEGDALTGGYLIEIDAYANQEKSMFKSQRGNPVTIKYPDEDDITTEQYNYIKDYFNKMEATLFSGDFRDDVKGYRPLLDVESFLQHFIVGEFSGNTDTYWSTYLYKDRGDDQFHVGPVWDFDLGFNNDNRTYDINNLSDYIYRTKGSLAGQMKSFVDRIVRADSRALEQLQDMWAQARYTKAIDADALNAFVDDMAATLDASQKLNFKRWNILNSYVHQNPRTYGSYEKEVEAVKNYITRRVEWMDKKLAYDPNGIFMPASDGSQRGMVYGLDGRALQHGMAGLAAGCYIVSDGKTTRKIIIK